MRLRTPEEAEEDDDGWMTATTESSAANDEDTAVGEEVWTEEDAGLGTVPAMLETEALLLMVPPAAAGAVDAAADVPDRRSHSTKTDPNGLDAICSISTKSL